MKVCQICGLPFEGSSYGGAFVCASCDCGVYRDGTRWTYQEAMNNNLLRMKAKEIYDKLQKNYNYQTIYDIDDGIYKLEGD